MTLRRWRIINDRPESSLNSGRSEPPILYSCQRFHSIPRSPERITKSIMNPGKGIDAISGLPEPIIHHIMSFLPEKDVYKIPILSKHFRFVWSTFPIIVFNQFFSKKRMGACKFLDHVMASIQLRQLDMDLQVFRLKVDLKDDRIDDWIDEIIRFALENNVHELGVKIIVEYKALRYKLSEGFSLRSLTYLKLSGLQFDIDWLISGCPLLKSLILSKCSITYNETNASHNRSPLTMLSFTRVNITDKWIEEHVSMFLNLETLVVRWCPKLRNFRVKNENLERLDFLGFSVLEGFEIVLEGFQIVAPNLRSLYLSEIACVTDKWLFDQVSLSRYLKNLKLQKCSMLGKIDFYDEGLQSLEILDCKFLDEVSLDAINLKSFAYRGDIITFNLMNSPNLHNPTLELKQRSQIVDIDEWNSLRNLLSFFSHCETLTLVCCSNKDFIILKDVRTSRLPPLSDVKHLKIIAQNSTIIDTMLVDNLLWLAPHLESLCFVVSRMEKIIKFHYNEGEEIRGDICSRGLPLNCWRDDCKYVELDNFEDADDQDQLYSYFLDNLQ